MHEPPRIFRLRIASLIALMASAQTGWGAELFWDAGHMPLTPTGGSGGWNTVTADWSNGASDLAWPNVATNNDRARFAGAPGFVSVDANITVGSIQFDVGGYVLGGSKNITVNIQAGTTASPGPALTASTGVEEVSIEIPLLVFTSPGAGVAGALTNTDKINFNNTIVAFSGSRQMALSNSSATATTSVTNWSVTSGTSNANVSLWLQQGSLTISNFAAGVSGSTQAAWNSASLGEFNVRGTGSGTLTLTGDNTKLNNAGVGALNITLTNANATLALGHDNALGAKDAAGNATDTRLLLNGGTVVALNDARIISNSVTLGANATIGGANPFTFAGSFTNSGGNRVLTITNTAPTTLSGPVFLANDNATTRTLTVGCSGNLAIPGAIANNDAGNSLASALTKTGAGVLTLAGANTYTGLTTVNQGVLALGANNVFADTAALKLNGAAFDAGGHADTLGSLDLDANSTISIAEGGAVAFASSAGQNWGTSTLLVSGRFASGSSLRFGIDASGLTPAQLALIRIPGHENLALDANGYLTATRAPASGTVIIFARVEKMAPASTRLVRRRA